MQPCSSLFLRSRGVVQKVVRTQRPVSAASASPAAPLVGRRTGSWLQLASATALVEELRGEQSGRAGEPPAGPILGIGPIPTEFPQPDVQPFPNPEPSVPGAPEVSPSTPPNPAPSTPPEVPPLISPPEPDTTEVPGQPSGPEVPSTPVPEILPDPGRGPETPVISPPDFPERPSGPEVPIPTRRQPDTPTTTPPEFPGGLPGIEVPGPTIPGPSPSPGTSPGPIIGGLGISAIVTPPQPVPPVGPGTGSPPPFPGNPGNPTPPPQTPPQTPPPQAPPDSGPVISPADAQFKEHTSWSPFNRKHLEPVDENQGGRPSQFVSDAAWASENHDEEGATFQTEDDAFRRKEKAAKGRRDPSKKRKRATGDRAVSDSEVGENGRTRSKSKKMRNEDVKKTAFKGGGKVLSRMEALASIESGTWRRRCEEQQLELVKKEDPRKAERMLANRRSLYKKSLEEIERLKLEKRSKSGARGSKKNDVQALEEALAAKNVQLERKDQELRSKERRLEKMEEERQNREDELQRKSEEQQSKDRLIECFHAVLMQQQLAASSYVHSMTGAPFGPAHQMALPPSMLTLPGGSGGGLMPIAIPPTPAEFPLIITDPGPGLIYATAGPAAGFGQVEGSQNARGQSLDPLVPTLRAVDSEENDAGS
ncbi:hypothetical protein KFL_000650220 [Klebsormidium nitens]|uniref:Uncharacterized protein n=1 Tax=Klebsormidium nitens TaxID=105231 RepID=A0A1Y1HUN5_KLENI|nr:hypothetical protein KFL_000650220 [Klebsormidium nitens]|eukprot:GAQ80889.1 hypothetical protein KFL_000650220 [Klebsormidium nitens]